jgi:hypothetical protein
MKLKLRNKKIIIENNKIPEPAQATPIVYDYELGTNHYKTVLTVNTETYEGTNITVNLDILGSTVSLQVDLYDINDRLIRTYKAEPKFCKLCLVGTQQLMDVYEELQKLYKENQELKEKGDVI